MLGSTRLVDVRSGNNDTASFICRTKIQLPKILPVRWSFTLPQRELPGRRPAEGAICVGDNRLENPSVFLCSEEIVRKLISEKKLFFYSNPAADVCDARPPY